MSLEDDLKKQVKDTFRLPWSTRKGQKIPEDSDVQLGNDGIHLEAVCLYADMAKSTFLVDNYKHPFATEIYKNFLYCASKIIRYRDGVITAFDGDRVMGIFIGDRKNSNAAKCALNINYAVREIINPSLKEQYKKLDYEVKHAVGIDTSDILVARTGIRGSNDLVWVGNSANYAAKLCDLRDGNYASWITEKVYKRLTDETKFGGKNNTNMWEKRNWTTKNMTIYRSNWRWGF